jgi:hypothetical protein
VAVSVGALSPASTNVTSLNLLSVTLVILGLHLLMDVSIGCVAVPPDTQRLVQHPARSIQDRDGLPLRRAGGRRGMPGVEEWPMDRRMQWIMTVGLGLVVGVGLVQAAEKPSPEHVAAMKAFNAANGKLRPLLAAETKDYAAIGAVADEWKGPAEAIAKIWGARNAEVGTKMSATVLKAVTDLAAAAKASDAAAVAAAGTVVTGSCRTCHTAHRTERLPDGTYEIK